MFILLAMQTQVIFKRHQSGLRGKGVNTFRSKPEWEPRAAAKVCGGNACLL